ncbi:hypothetical protein GGD89_003993, partial [Roseospira visakhapatnamensis]|nr:hypothetical protein [Roseospira visakhapatnamensis]
GPGAPDVTDTDAPDTDGDRKTHQGEISP